MTTEPTSAQAPATNSSGLTIGELARRTGVNVGTLRMWEARHGFPRGRRLPSGHRRYDEPTVDLVQQVLRRREAGARLEAAIQGAVAAASAARPPSVYAELTRGHPTLLPHRLRKSTLLALTWALEDECCSRAQEPWLIGAFQDERFYRQAEGRWRDLARTARGAWALAHFDGSAPAGGRPIEVALPESSPMTREWSLVCLAADLPAALAAWELPGQDDVADGDRVFESVWTLDPVAVRDAAGCAGRLLTALGHDTDDTDDLVAAAEDPRPPAPADLPRATALFNRIVAYLDRVR